MNTPDQKEKLGIRLVQKLLGILLVFVAVTFLVAGRLDYWQGWVVNRQNFLFIFLTYLVLIDRKDLIKERLKPGEGMKRWDKIYYMVSTPLFFVMFILSILDATRFSWYPTVPVVFIVIGIILYCVGQIILLWTKRANRFFSSVVRIQKDRTQTVCDTGPYQFFRHPGYLGGLIFSIGTLLTLGSFWGLIPAIVTLLLIFGRTVLEDITLKQELPGYKEYSTKVRYRIIPFLW